MENVRKFFVFFRKYNIPCKFYELSIEIFLPSTRLYNAHKLKIDLHFSWNRLHNEEQGRKVEVAALKLRYENHVTAISNELKDVQSQLMRFKHERNTYKHLLENAQKSAAEVKLIPGTNKRDISNSEEVNYYKVYFLMWMFRCGTVNFELWHLVWLVICWSPGKNYIHVIGLEPTVTKYQYEYELNVVCVICLQTWV